MKLNIITHVENDGKYRVFLDLFNVKQVGAFHWFGDLWKPIDRCIGGNVIHINYQFHLRNLTDSYELGHFKLNLTFVTHSSSWAFFSCRINSIKFIKLTGKKRKGLNYDKK